MQAFADGGLAGPEALCQGSIVDDHKGSAYAFGGCKVAASKEENGSGAEVTRKINQNMEYCLSIWNQDTKSEQV